MHFIFGPDGAPPSTSPIDLVVTDSAGTIVQTLTVGTSNVADLVVLDGHMVSAYVDQGFTLLAHHVQSPPAGAVVRLPQAWSMGGSFDDPTDMTVHAFISGYPANSAYFSYTTDCLRGDAGFAGPFTLTAGCFGNPTWDLVMVAVGTNGQLAWGALLDQTTQPGQSAQVALTLDQTAFEPFNTHAYLPAGSTAAYTGFFIRSANGAMLGGTYNAGVQPDGTWSVQPLTVPAGLAGWVDTRITIGFENRYATLQHVRPGTVADEILDFTSLQLPAASRPIVDHTIPTRPELLWVETSGSIPDAKVVSTYWGGTPDVLQFFYLPADATGLRFPEIPEALAAYRPGSATISTSLGLIDRSDSAGYVDFLATGSLVPQGGAGAELFVETSESY